MKPKHLRCPLVAGCSIVGNLANSLLAGVTFRRVLASFLCIMRMWTAIRDKARLFAILGTKFVKQNFNINNFSVCLSTLYCLHWLFLVYVFIPSPPEKIVDTHNQKDHLSLACQKTVSPLLTPHVNHCSPGSKGPFYKMYFIFLYLQNSTMYHRSCFVILFPRLALVCGSFFCNAPLPQL